VVPVGNAETALHLERTKGENWQYARIVLELRACRVSYQDLEGVTHSIEVTAQTLCEAAILGMQAMKVPRWQDRPSLKYN
jgi:hypothetical protein